MLKLELLKRWKQNIADRKKAEPVRASGPPASAGRTSIERDPQRYGFQEISVRVEPFSAAATFDLSKPEKGLETILDAKSIIGEQFRYLRTRLALVQRQRGTKSLLMTSAVPGEGKSLIACGLACVLAQEPGKRVLLIEADLRKPRASRILTHSDPEKGLTQVLQGKLEVHECVLRANQLDLFVLPAGSAPPNPSELLSSAAIDRILIGASPYFHWILLDSPPVVSISDATLMAAICDAALLVVRANVTSSKLVQRALQRIGREKTLGVIMNQVRRLDSSAYYYQYYQPTKK